MICLSHQLKSNCCSVSFGVSTDYTTRGANGMASKWSYKNRIRVIRVNFYENFDQGKVNFVCVSGEFKLSEFELTE